MKYKILLFILLCFYTMPIIGQSQEELITQFKTIDTLFYKYFPSEIQAKKLSNEDLIAVTKLYFKQKEILNKIKGKPGLHFEFHRFKGVYFRWAGLYEDSNENLKKSYRYFYEIMRDTGSVYYDNSILQGFLGHNDMAQNYLAMSKVDSATYIYKKCVYFVHVYSGLDMTKASAYNNLGIHYLDNLNLLDSANYFFKKAKKLVESDTTTPVKNKILLGSIKDNLGGIYLKQKKIAKAKQIFKENIVFYNPNTYKYTPDYRRWIKARTQLAEVYLLEKNYKDFNKELHHTKVILDSSKFEGKEYSLMRYLNLKKEYYLLKHQYKEAYEEETKIELIENNLKRQDRFFNESWNYNINEALLQNMQNEAQAIEEVKVLKQEKKRYYIWGIMLFLLLLIGIFAYAFLKRRMQTKLVEIEVALRHQDLKKVAIEKEQLQTNFKDQKSEMKEYMEKLSQKIDTLKEYEKIVATIHEKQGKERATALHNLETQLTKEAKGIDTDQDLEKNSSQSITFKNKLREAFPKLTANDITLCLYIYLNKENNEIADILKITTASVSQKKYRLKKKLALQKQEDLSAFLLQIGE